MSVPNIVTDPSKRHDFLLLFDVKDGNPNGDPDAGNMPRVDPQTMQGLVTDVCIKRKVRNFVAIAKVDDPAYKIYVEKEVALNNQHARAYEALGKEPIKNPSKEVKQQTRQWMCQNFYDIRMFGAVMSTGVNCGQVLGPVQMTFARSFDPVTSLDFSITRVAITREEDRAGKNANKETEMGRKALVPYGLYKSHGFFSPHHARDTEVSADDLALFWAALRQMWELDRSASRGMMGCRGLIVFSHDNPLGNAPAHQLFERLKVTCKHEESSPREFSDYDLALNEENVPEGITISKLVW